MNGDRIVVVDDLRYFPELEATYLRSLSEALAWWETYRVAPEPVELWLDHDLGGFDTIRPLVVAIEEHLMTVGGLPLSVRIVTDNPVGRRWMRQALGTLVHVSEDTPPWRLAPPPPSEETP